MSSAESAALHLDCFGVFGGFRVFLLAFLVDAVVVGPARLTDPLLRLCKAGTFAIETEVDGGVFSLVVDIVE